MASPVQVKIGGQALNSFGLTNDDSVSGVGLNTFGFLWASEDIWTPTVGTITTTWVRCDNCTEGEDC
jgi:hypothetical protein